MGATKATKFKNEEGQTISEFTGRSWMGTYDDGTLGFCASNFLSEHPAGLSSDQRDMLAGKSWYPSDLYRVEVSVRLVLNKRGQLLVKKNKNRKKI